MKDFLMEKLEHFLQESMMEFLYIFIEGVPKNEALKELLKQYLKDYGRNS